MATKPHTARARAWNTAFKKYLNLNQQLSQAQAQERDALERAIAAQQDELLELPAPSFEAVIRKLQMLWEADIEKPDQDGAEKALIIEDLQDLISETTELLGSAHP